VNARFDGTRKGRNLDSSSTIGRVHVHIHVHIHDDDHPGTAEAATNVVADRDLPALDPPPPPNLKAEEDLDFVLRLVLGLRADPVIVDNVTTATDATKIIPTDEGAVSLKDVGAMQKIHRRCHQDHHHHHHHRRRHVMIPEDTPTVAVVVTAMIKIADVVAGGIGTETVRVTVAFVAETVVVAMAVAVAIAIARFPTITAAAAASNRITMITINIDSMQSCTVPEL